jgi:hypothetical protein
MIHRATHGQMHSALQRIAALPCVSGTPQMIRVEHFT